MLPLDRGIHNNMEMLRSEYGVPAHVPCLHIHQMILDGYIRIKSKSKWVFQTKPTSTRTSSKYRRTSIIPRRHSNIRSKRRAARSKSRSLRTTLCSGTRGNVMLATILEWLYSMDHEASSIESNIMYRDISTQLLYIYVFRWRYAVVFGTVCCAYRC